MNFYECYDLTKKFIKIALDFFSSDYMMNVRATANAFPEVHGLVADVRGFHRVVLTPARLIF